MPPVHVAMMMTTTMMVPVLVVVMVSVRARVAVVSSWCIICAHKATKDKQGGLGQKRAPRERKQTHSHYAH